MATQPFYVRQRIAVFARGVGADTQPRVIRGKVVALVPSTDCVWVQFEDPQAHSEHGPNGFREIKVKALRRCLVLSESGTKGVML